MTKKCLEQEWSMGIAEAIEAEAQAQAIYMQTRDYGRATAPSSTSASPSSRAIERLVLLHVQPPMPAAP